MNIREIAPGTNGTLQHYIGATFALTLPTIWIIMTFQSRYRLPQKYSFFQRLGWPVLLTMKGLGWITPDPEGDHDTYDSANQHDSVDGRGSSNMSSKRS